MSPPSASSKRRRFQAPITTYFKVPSAASTSDPPSYALPPSSPPPSTSTPALPSTVQSSLLNVGMRVRKSVAEGYKTHHTLPSQTWGGYTVSKPVFQAENCTYDNSHDNTSSGASSGLLPLCGLHKIGNLAVQPIVPLSSYTPHGQHLSAAALEDSSVSLPSSQDSISTTNSANYAQIPSRPKTKKKREFETLIDDDDLDEDIFPAGSDFPFSFTHSAAAPSTPSGAASWATPLSPTHDSVSNRAIAVPRSRRGEMKRGSVAAEGSVGMGQENFYAEDQGDGGDFGPVGFLRPRGECEQESIYGYGYGFGDRDVEMG